MSARAPRRLEESAIVPELAPYITEVAAIETRTAAYLALPRTGVQLLVRRWPGAAAVDVHVIGPRISTLRKRSVGHRALVIRLAPGAARAIAGTSIAALAGRAVPLAELWRVDAGRVLAELAAGDEREYSAIVQAALARRLRSLSSAPPDAIARAAALLETDPTLRVSELAARIGLSERQLRRRFEDELGLAPKRFARVVRFRRALALARSATGWAGVAVAAGYYDQAHMIGEFRATAGATPAGLLREVGLLVE